jgi:hypothetical protein
MNFGKRLLFCVVVSTGLAGLARAESALEREIRELQEAANSRAKNAAVTGDPSFSAKQSQKLFDKLTVSNGMVPGEERVGFVVCSSGGTSMGNISIPDCHVETEMPQTVIDHCKAVSKPSIFKKSKTKH